MERVVRECAVCRRRSSTLNNNRHHHRHHHHRPPIRIRPWRLLTLASNSWKIFRRTRQTSALKSCLILLTRAISISTIFCNETMPALCAVDFRCRYWALCRFTMSHNGRSTTLDEMCTWHSGTDDFYFVCLRINLFDTL